IQRQDEISHGLSDTMVEDIVQQVGHRWRPKLHFLLLLRRRLMSDTNGKICYIELPATDVAASEKFYSTVFGWPMRTRGDGSHAFDDTTGQVSGAFVKGRRASAAVGTLFYIMVDDVAYTCNAIE